MHPINSSITSKNKGRGVIKSIVIRGARFMLALVNLLVAAKVGDNGEVSAAAFHIASVGYVDISIVELRHDRTKTHVSRQCGCTCEFGASLVA